MKKEERINRIIARGETSGHSHIIVGEATIERKGDIIIANVTGKCAIKHLLEKPFVEEGIEVWTEEHHDIDFPLETGKHEFVQQIEYNPYEKAIKKVID